MLPGERHFASSGHIAHENGDPVAAWQPPTAVSGVVALCRPALAERGSWRRSCRACPRAYFLRRLDHPRGPSLHRRYAAPTSLVCLACQAYESVLRPPRTPAVQRPLSRGRRPRAPRRPARLAPPRAAQTGLSCSAHLPDPMPRPVPRKDPRAVPQLDAWTWPSRGLHPRALRRWLGSPIVYLSRLQASLHVAAWDLAPSVEALDAPLQLLGSLRGLGACYRALRRLPGRDLHPLETCSLKRSGGPLSGSIASSRHDAPWRDRTIVRAARPPERQRFMTQSGHPASSVSTSVSVGQVGP